MNQDPDRRQRLSQNKSMAIRLGATTSKHRVGAENIDYLTALLDAFLSCLLAGTTARYQHLTQVLWISSQDHPFRVDTSSFKSEQPLEARSDHF